MSIRKRTWTAKKKDKNGVIREVERIAWVVDYKDQAGDPRSRPSWRD